MLLTPWASFNIFVLYNRIRLVAEFELQNATHVGLLYTGVFLFMFMSLIETFNLFGCLKRLLFKYARYILWEKALARKYVVPLSIGSLCLSSLFLYRGVSWVSADSVYISLCWLVGVSCLIGLSAYLTYKLFFNVSRFDNHPWRPFLVLLLIPRFCFVYWGFSFELSGTTAVIVAWAIARQWLTVEFIMSVPLFPRRLVAGPLVRMLIDTYNTKGDAAAMKYYISVRHEITLELHNNAGSAKAYQDFLLSVCMPVDKTKPASTLFALIFTSKTCPFDNNANIHGVALGVQKLGPYFYLRSILSGNNVRGTPDMYILSQKYGKMTNAVLSLLEFKCKSGVNPHWWFTGVSKNAPVHPGPLRAPYVYISMKQASLHKLILNLGSEIAKETGRAVGSLTAAEILNHPFVLKSPALGAKLDRPVVVAIEHLEQLVIAEFINGVKAAEAAGTLSAKLVFAQRADFEANLIEASTPESSPSLAMTAALDIFRTKPGASLPLSIYMKLSEVERGLLSAQGYRITKAFPVVLQKSVITQAGSSVSRISYHLGDDDMLPFNFDEPHHYERVTKRFWVNRYTIYHKPIGVYTDVNTQYLNHTSLSTLRNAKVTSSVAPRIFSHLKQLPK